MAVGTAMTAAHEASFLAMSLRSLPWLSRRPLTMSRPMSTASVMVTTWSCTSSKYGERSGGTSGGPLVRLEGVLDCQRMQVKGQGKPLRVGLAGLEQVDPDDRLPVRREPVRHVGW
jgi:hypothetical protein